MVAETLPPKGGSISLPSNFEIHGVTNKLNSEKPAATPLPPLRVLDNFQGKFAGNGFNTIFRPQSSATPTKFPIPPPPGSPTDNVLELNLTVETLDFTNPLGSVPNRGLFAQGDIFLSGVPYVQTISDVTNPATGLADAPSTGIHFEPGLWMRVPASKTNPVQVESLNRMASIPHGTTINAQGLAPTDTDTTPGPPKIDPVNISPFVIGGDPSQPVKPPFPSQTAASNNTLRLPQDLTKFIAAGTITQDILTDPNTVLRNANKGKTINKTTTFKVSTFPTAAQSGGGTANIDFLVGGKTGPNSGPNAQAFRMNATFWISEVSHKLIVPIHALGQGPLEIAAPSPVANAPAGFQAPSFIVDPPAEITTPKTITVTSTQIQYSQNVTLNFAGLSWPHVSVATLIPKDPVKVPNTVFT